MRNLILIIGLLINLSLFSQEVNIYPDLSKNDTLTIPYINENFKIPFGLSQDETIAFLNKEPYASSEFWLKYKPFFSLKNSDLKITDIYFGFYKGKFYNVRVIFQVIPDSIQYKKHYNDLYSEISKNTGGYYKIELPENTNQKDENINHFDAFRYLGKDDYFSIYFKKGKTEYSITSSKYTNSYVYELFIDNAYFQE